MYKLILVEDEEEVRESVVQEIDWASCGFEVADTAENGSEAMELIEKWAPDVVVTDIRMPFMDGLQLSEWIRGKYPMTKIIILTGYDEFEYAQKAVKMHIDEYVLKPFSTQELMQALAKIKRLIDEEIARKENVLTLQEHYRQSLPVLREVFLGSLMNRKLPRAEIEQKSLNYNVKIDGASFVVSVLSMDNPGGEEAADPNGRRAGSQSLKYSKDQELKLFAILNISEEIVNKYEAGIVFLHNGNLVLLTAAAETDQEAVSKRTASVLEEIRQSIEKYVKLSVTIGVGTVTADIANVSYSYKSAVMALDYRLILGNNRIIMIDDVEKRAVEKLQFDELKEHALIRCIKVGTLQEMKELVDELFQGIEAAPVSFKDYQIYLLEMLTAILKAAKDANPDLDPVLGASFNPFAEIHKLTNPQEAKDWIAGLCGRLMSSIVSERQSSYKSLVDKAKAYALAHYHESDISINKVCSHLHISAGYFSGIFKKETRMTFVGYLLHIRMEAAKEMLRTTDLKTFEIAEKVGYSEPNYFSYSFRKYVGVSPKEYKNSSREA
ncbi:putative response regulatory protein [Paenibacillus konkukensis]|uniref:Response regulatory protein n=1 Tax=Paenibacillus konkukensis TaxID=2020716 RepID=A0ABY4RW22_9BACL|nr:response regulator [Paenibacillus konkukensis]UQZ85753.1 putative response regulatory protein [Paenibacillus konkukensis]